MTEILFPTVDPANPDADGVVSTWYAADGEPVRIGQLIAEVSVDKATAEVTADRAGTLHISAEEGAIVQQSAPIGSIT